MTPPPTATHWPLAFALIFAGVIAAFQTGKPAIAAPLLRADLGISLAYASWIVSAYAALGAFAGFPVGIAISRFGARRAAVLGLLVLGVASCLGAMADSGLLLLISRIIEGVGFIAVVIAIPTLLRTVSAARDRDLVMSYWSAYVPVGMVIIMLAGPWIAAGHWQRLWLANGVLALLYAVVVWRIAPAERVAPRADENAFANARQVLHSRGPVLLALAFGLYTFHYHALTGLMPTLLVDRLGMSIGSAGAINAITIVANGIGNLSAGFLLRRGLPLWLVIAVAFVMIAAMAFGIFADSMPATIVATMASLSLGLSGVVPGAIFAGVSRYTPHPALLAITLGVIVQASTIGQFVGPAALGGWAEHIGWSTAPFFILVVAACGIVVAFALKRTPAASSR